MASPKRRKSTGHRRDDLDVFMDKENDAAEEWIRNNPAIKKLLDEEGASGSSVAADSATVESGGEEFSRLSSVANTSSDAANPLTLMMEKESKVSDFVWPDNALINRKATLSQAVARLGFAGQDPADVISRIEAHITKLGSQKSTETVKKSIDYWSTKVNALKFFQKDEPLLAQLFEEKDPATILSTYKFDKFEYGKQSRIYSDAVTDLWGGEPKFDTTNAPPTASIPTMITQEMKAKLKGMGVTDDEIFNMTPEQAHAKLGSVPKGVTPSSATSNLDDAYAAAIRAAKATGEPVSVANIQKWTNLKSVDATTLMARMDDEGLLGSPGKKGGRPFLGPKDTQPTVETPPPDAPAPKDVAPTGGSSPQKPATPGRFDKFFKGVKGVAAAEKAGLVEAGDLLSKGKILKGLGRGLGTWTGGAALALGPMMLGSAVRRVLDANPWGESESSSQDRETVRTGMDPGDLLNRVRLESMQKQSAMQALMSNPQLQAALQRQIQGRQMMKTGKLPGDVVLGGSLDSGPFDDPEGLMALMQGR